MMDNAGLGFSGKDRDILRRLAERKRVIADDPVNIERRNAWYALDAGVDDRVMILAEYSGIRDARHPVPSGALECTGDWAREIESALRGEIYQFDELADDHVVEPSWNINWWVHATNYGVDAVVHRGGDDAHMGSYSWEPPVKDLDADFARLHPRSFRVDRDATLLRKAALEKLFGDILPVRIRGGHYWTLGLTWKAIELVGLEGLMLAMYDNPDGLHRLMAFLRDDHLAFSAWLESEGLYTLNNENDYTGSGSMGYSRCLPAADYDGLRPVQRRDLWVLSESQETVGVGPDQFAEFIFPYQNELAGLFGRCYYGCCEPLHGRWHVIRGIRNLARVSVSPWCDQDFMAAELGRGYVFSRKPNPTLISTSMFDEDAIRADMRQTLDVARGCRL